MEIPFCKSNVNFNNCGKTNLGSRGRFLLSLVVDGFCFHGGFVFVVVYQASFFAFDTRELLSHFSPTDFFRHTSFTSLTATLNNF